MTIRVLSAPQRPAADYIRTMFDGFARRYDAFTFLIGLGQDGRLRRKALEGVGPGQRVLDIGCGTGALSFAALDKVGPAGEVVGIDFSPNMIAQAVRRAELRGGPPRGSVRFFVRGAEDLPFADERFDAVVSAYVLRNLYENIHTILRGLRGSLKPGGYLGLLDLTEPSSRALRTIYRFYLSCCVGLYGLVLFGRDYPVPYLPDSSKRFLDRKEFMRVMEQAGFTEVRARAFMLGAVTLYTARAPLSPGDM